MTSSYRNEFLLREDFDEIDVGDSGALSRVDAAIEAGLILVDVLQPELETLPQSKLHLGCFQIPVKTPLS